MNPTRLLLLLALLACAGVPAEAFATSAKVSAVVNDVRLFSTTGRARVAAVGDVISGSASLRTGAQSRSDLRFADNSLLRIGSNSAFAFTGNRANYELKSGAVFLQTGKGSKGARIRSGAITAAISGSAAYLLRTEGHVELGSLGGTVDAELELQPGKIQKHRLQPGQMIVVEIKNGKATGVFKIFWFDVGRMVRTASLLKDIPDSEPEDTAENIRGRKDVNTLSVVTTGDTDGRPFQDTPTQVAEQREAPRRTLFARIFRRPEPEPVPVRRPSPPPVNGGGDPPDNGGGDPPDNGGGDPPDNGGGDPPDNGGGDPPDNGGGDPPDNGGGDPPPDGEIDGGDGGGNGPICPPPSDPAFDPNCFPFCESPLIIDNCRLPDGGLFFNGQFFPPVGN